MRTHTVKILISILIAIIGIRIFFTKAMPLGKTGNQIDIGYYAYPLSSCFLFLSIMIIYSILKNK